MDPPIIPYQAPATASASPWVSPPSAEHLEQIAAARQRSAKLRKMATWGTVSAWTTAIFAASTMVCSVTSPTGMVLGAAMAVVAWFEFKGVNELKRLKPIAPRRMAVNQLVFGAILFVYGAWSLWNSLHAPSELAGHPELQQVLGDVGSLETSINVAVYVSVMLAAILGPGLTAIYYRSRAKHLDAYLAETPQWILDLQRAGMTI
jgi:hypothetical protein